MSSKNITFYVLLGSSAVCIFLSLILMNAARDRVEKGRSQSDMSFTSANTSLATANMILYGLFVIFMGYALYEFWSCKHDAASKDPVK